MAARSTANASWVRDPYFNWLSDMVWIDVQDRNKDYQTLLWALYERDFYGFIPNDDNRSADGKKLRDVFADMFPNTRGIGKKLGAPCSVLEMLIGLATRIENHLLGEGDEEEMKRWFWSMLENLELTRFTNEVCRSWEIARIRIDEILTIFLSREYSSYGKGGLFPLRKSKNDQRNVEIWYQFNEYLMENAARIPC